MKFLLPLLAACFLAACGTVPQPLPAHEKPAIIVLRDSGLFGAGCDAVVLINGKRIGVLSHGKHLTYDVSPGLYKVSIALGDAAGGLFGAMCGNLFATQLVEVTTKPAYLRIGFSGGSGQVMFETIER